MDCSICSNFFSSHGQPTCASCARAIIYQARLNHLTNLLAKESLRKSVDTLVTPRSQIDTVSLPPSSSPVDTAESIAKQQHDRVLGEIEAIKARHALITQQLSLLKKQTEDARADSIARKAIHERRRADLASERKMLHARLPQLLDPLQSSIRHMSRKLDKVHARTREGRVKLCHETARLASLRQRRRKTSDGRIIEDYTIGGVPIPDLRHLHTSRSDQVTAALANTCRLLTTTCHYLSIRLPAEITPAHANYPHPTIFSIQSSYQGFDLPFPGLGSPRAASQSPTNSRLLEHRSLPKLRLLHLDKPLIRLAREDPVSYNLFVEGITLLAWDVGWLCRSQGLPIANSWDDVCDLGKNLCLLFRVHTAANNHPDKISPTEQPIPTPRFGDLSHAGIQTNIEAPMGLALMRSWRLASPHRIIDKLKSHLLTEMSGAEWELIAESEWDVEREDEQAVLVGGARLNDMDSFDGAESLNQGKRASGWTKVKSRGTG